MGIAAEILEGVFLIGKDIYTGYKQGEILKEGEKKSEKIRLQELAESSRMFSRNLKETKRQFDLSHGLKQEELGMAQEQIARNTFRDQVSRLTSILDKNESLENLYINRLAGLRR